VDLDIRRISDLTDQDMDMLLTRGLDPYPIRDKVGTDLDIKSHPQVIYWISKLNH
jgi:hypothetical protein